MLSVIMLSVMAPTTRLKHYKCDQLTCAETEVEVFPYLSSFSLAFIRKSLQYLCDTDNICNEYLIGNDIEQITNIYELIIAIKC